MTFLASVRDVFAVPKGTVLGLGTCVGVPEVGDDLPGRDCTVTAIEFPNACVWNGSITLLVNGSGAADIKSGDIIEGGS